MLHLHNGSNAVLLQHTRLAATDSVTLKNIIDRNGEPFAFNTNDFSWDSAMQGFAGIVTISDQTTEQYLRLFYEIKDDSGNIKTIQEFMPQDAKFTVSATSSSSAEIIPVQYFLDYALSATSKLDSQFKEVVDNFAGENRDGIRQALLAAEGELASRLDMPIRENQYTEREDYVSQDYASTFWQVQANNTPINELVKYEFKFGSMTAAEVPGIHFVVQREYGIIEFLPTPSNEGAGIYSIVATHLAMFSTPLTAIGGVSGYTRVPGLLQFTYKAGLIPSDESLTKQEEIAAIRNAICRRALLNLLPTIDPRIRLGSMSESTDGHSASMSVQAQQLFRHYMDMEEQVIKSLKSRYGRQGGFAVV